MSETKTPENYIAEVQGLYGPVTLSERIFQQIWHRGDFRRDGLKTLAGTRLEILNRGRPNRLEGPDFIGAELLIDGQKIIGDVEFHFYAQDWNAHGHEENPAFGNVVLHVVLFPPGKTFPRENSRGDAMETFLLLPHMTFDIEEYASSEALAAIENRQGIAVELEILLKLEERERVALLRKRAQTRYRQKVGFIEKRLAETDFETLAHQLILETLGLRRNRETMAKLALKFSSSTMLLTDAESLFRAGMPTWKLAGIRPANHPKCRLKQYLSLLEKNPHWAREAVQLVAEISGESPVGGNVGKFRSAEKLARKRKNLTEKIFAGTLGGTRFDTLMCDAVFPLAAAARKRDFFEPWFCWFLGDNPGRTAKVLRDAGVVSRERPLCNGFFQGLIQTALERGNR